jgi:hypothetical protein
MKDYFRTDIEIKLDFDEHKKILKERIQEELLVPISNYKSKLIYNQRKPEYSKLTIYYHPGYYLFEILEFLSEKGICILETVKEKTKEQKWEFPDILDFSESKLINLQASNSWEHNEKPVILTIDSLSILQSGKFVEFGNFKITENIFQHLDDYIQYGQLANYKNDDKFIETDNNRETNFGVVRFKLSFKHSYDNSTKFNIDISRDSFLIITNCPKTLTDLEIIEIGNSLCLLMSFYWQKTIDFFNARVRINNNENYHTREILKYSNHLIDESDQYILKKQFGSFYDFIDSINYTLFSENSELIKELVPRIIRTKNVDKVSAFMILYNIIEKIRNYCISVPLKGKELSIKEEFNFTKGKKSTDKFIKLKIKEIEEIVDDSDREDFLNKASDKVSFIKKTGLIDQFESLLSHLELNVLDYNINFTNLIQIRNSIYHGKLPKEDVTPYNEQMTILIYDMLLKLMIE